MRRLVRQLVAALRSIAPVLSVTLALLGLVTYSLTEAEWVPESGRYTIGLWFGALCGALLAATRWRPRTALGYSLLLSLVAASEAVGRVLPSPTSLLTSHWTDVLWGMQVRLLTLLDQFNAWITAIASGAVIRDTGLFVWLAALLVWNAGAWLAWGLMREKRPLEALLPLGGLLALNNHLSARPIAETGLFLAGAIFLIGYLGFHHLRMEWNVRRVSYAEYIETDWALAMAVITLALGAAVIVAPLFGTPEGWRTLAELFRAAQEQTAQATSRLFAGVNPPRSDEVRVNAFTPDLTLIGRPLPQGLATVMWVTTSDPAPPPPEIGPSASTVPQHYWRSQVFATYTGTGWEPATSEAREAGALPEPPVGRYALWQRYEIVAIHGNELFAVNAPVSASAEIDLRVLPAEYDTLLEGALSQYEVTSWATRLTTPQLAGASTDYPPGIRAPYLQLPPELPARVRDLAARLTSGAATPLAKALRVQNYLRETYPYREDVPPPPPGRDAVDYFLFDAPGGYCSYYASAMAVLLRVAGVPARVASGFATGAYDYERGAYHVPVSAAHAWVEVYFPGYGWAEFEPTASRAPFEYGAELAPVAGPVIEPPPAAGRASPISPVWYAVASIVLAIAAWLLWPLYRDRLQQPASIAALYWRMRRALALAGLSAPASTTPDEFANAVAPSLEAHPALSDAVRHATALYRQAAYSPHPVNESQTYSARSRWQSAQWEWMKLWLAAMTQRIRPARQ